MTDHATALRTIEAIAADMVGSRGSYARRQGQRLLEAAAVLRDPIPQPPAVSYGRPSKGKSHA